MHRVVISNLAVHFYAQQATHSKACIMFPSCPPHCLSVSWFILSQHRLAHSEHYAGHRPATPSVWVSPFMCQYRLVRTLNRRRCKSIKWPYTRLFFFKQALVLDTTNLTHSSIVLMFASLWTFTQCRYSIVSRWFLSERC